jgi:Transglycosylase-like domain
MLKTRIGVVLVTLAAIAFPALAVAAVAADKAPIGPAETKGVQIGALQRPAKDFHKAIETAKQKIRAQHRRQREREQAYATLPGGVSQDTLETIAACESGGDPTAVSADGQFRGKYQFSRATWRDLGGSGDPAAAPESVQDAIAAKLLAQRGTSPWPVCG